MNLPVNLPVIRCHICFDTGRRHDPYCERGACNLFCYPCPRGCPPKVYTPNGDEVAPGPVIIRRDGRPKD